MWFLSSVCIHGALNPAMEPSAPVSCQSLCACGRRGELGAPFVILQELTWKQQPSVESIKPRLWVLLPVLHLDVDRTLASKMSAWREILTSGITCSTDLPSQPPVCPETYSRKLDPGAPRFLSIGCKCSTGPREVSPASVICFQGLARTVPEESECRRYLGCESWTGCRDSSRISSLVPVRKRHGGE